MLISLLSCVATAIAIVSFAALVNTGSPNRRILGIVLSLPALWTPWIAPASMPVIRLLAGMAAIQGCMRMVELARERTERTAVQRVLHAISIFDAREAKKVPRRFDGASATRFAAFTALAILSFYTAVNLSLRISGPVHYLVRWLAGAAFCYSVADCTDGLVRTSSAALGMYSPEMHLAPIRSRTLWEFWGVRWNRNFSQYVYAHFFLPNARRGRAKLGIVLAFTFSSFVHAYFTTAAAGFFWGAAMFTYFFSQGLLVMVERKSGVLRLSPVLTRAWMVLAILIPSPLATEPLLQVFQSAVHL